MNMRWVHLAIVGLFAAATLIFVWQNFEPATMSFLGLHARTPLALLIALAYLAGMATGGSLFSLLRRSIHKSGLTELADGR
jgi:putative membrane protein